MGDSRGPPSPWASSGTSLCYKISQLPKGVYLYHILMSSEQRIAEKNVCNKVQVSKFLPLATPSQLFKAKQQTLLTTSCWLPGLPPPSPCLSCRPVVLTRTGYQPREPHQGFSILYLVKVNVASSPPPHSFRTFLSGPASIG